MPEYIGNGEDSFKYKNVGSSPKSTNNDSSQFLKLLNEEIARINARIKATEIEPVTIKDIVLPLYAPRRMHEVLERLEAFVEAAKFREDEQILSCLSELSSSEDPEFEDAANLVRERFALNMPRTHVDYWKYHCVTCGLLLNGQPEQEGYCECE